MAKRSKELQQLAALPAELEPELQFDAQGLPRDVANRTEEVRGDQAIARAYLAERGLVNPRFSPVEAVFRGATFSALGLGIGSVVVAILGTVTLDDRDMAMSGLAGALTMVPLGILISDLTPMPKVVKKLAAQLTKTRREKLRSWAASHYGTEVNDELLSKLQSELAAQEIGALAQLQSKATVPQEALLSGPPRKFEELNT